MRGWGPDGQELLTRGEGIAAVRSAPWTLWVGTVLLGADQVLGQVLEPRSGKLIVLPIMVLDSALVLAGIRLAWQWMIVLGVGYLAFAFTPHNTVWGAIVAVPALVFLLAPRSRNYFRPGRVWLPRRVARMDHGVWEKGGVRRLALMERVPAYLAPRVVSTFFVARRGRGRISPFSMLFRREYVVVTIDDGVVVLRLRRPGFFRARIAGTVADLPATDSRLAWDGEGFTIDGRAYRPIPHHEADAMELARRLGSARDRAGRSPA